ncbi:hypothetical protein DJ017_06140 [Phenylobacterium soli]|uniref:Uncharacterized protein n=1 Tax=Phenylobacterium soli TaxID=2170551 RepID=A0A328AHA8_9CAUL|nr:hypothetical protein DJ017_06140 [Phenylobacterium soli]
MSRSLYERPPLVIATGVDVDAVDLWLRTQVAPWDYEGCGNLCDIRINLIGRASGLGRRLGEAKLASFGQRDDGGQWA